jgi:hypothetical protein
MNWTTIGLASLVLLAGCAATCPPPPAVKPVVIEKSKLVDTACDWTSPITIDSVNDKLTDLTADEILKHNRAGAEHCGWTPKAKTQ